MKNFLSKFGLWLIIVTVTYGVVYSFIVFKPHSGADYVSFTFGVSAIIALFYLAFVTKREQKNNRNKTNG